MGQRRIVVKIGEHITKISQVTPEVTLFLRSLGFSNYYIIRIFDLVGESAISLTEDNPYWLLDEFPRLGFAKTDEVARKLGVEADNRYRIEAAIALCMRYYTGEGHSYAPYKELCEKAASLLEIGGELIEDVLEDMVFDGRLQLADVGGMRAVYFYGYYKAECGVAGKLAQLENPAGGLKAVGGDMEALLAKAERDAGLSLADEQKSAVRNALLSGVSIVTGGPGTGKTTIIKALLAIVEGSGMKAAVAAPTGRAAKRVMEASGHFACTVHRLLEYFYNEESNYMAFARNRERPLEQDVIIIDEASMLDLLLTEALCEAIKPGTRLIFVGDSDQLPSVGAGNVLADLIASEYFFTARLTEIHRQSAQSSIVLNAHRINSGEYPSFAEDFSLLRASKQQDISDKLVALASSFQPESVQVLTPVKKGIIGAASLNERLQAAFNPPSEDKAELKFGSTIFRVGDRVMQTKNDYRIEYRNGAAENEAAAVTAATANAAVTADEAAADGKKSLGEMYRTPDGKPDGKGVFNGEIGIVAAIDAEMKSVSVVYDGFRWVEYQYIQLDEIELAYAITVHKSQGSEFKTVIMPMSWFPPVLATRSLVYTAVTRAKEQVVIVGDPAYMNAMVDNNQSGNRNSGLADRLTSMYMGMA